VPPECVITADDMLRGGFPIDRRSEGKDFTTETQRRGGYTEKTREVRSPWFPRMGGDAR
jgi:hypothetical protein